MRPVDVAHLFFGTYLSIKLVSVRASTAVNNLKKPEIVFYA